MSSPPGTVYRDAAPGVEARVAELRTVWAARAAQVQPAAKDALRARLKRIGAGKAAVAMQLVLVVALATRLVPWLHLPRASGCVQTPPDMIGAYLFMAFAVIKLLAWAAAHARAEGRIAALLEPPGDLERLANLTPQRAIAEEAARAESASVTWHILGANFSALLLCWMTADALTLGFAPGLSATLRELGHISILQVAVLSIATSTLGIDHRWPNLRIVQGVMLIVSTLLALGSLSRLIPFVLQLVFLGVRVARLQRPLRHEREALA